MLPYKAGFFLNNKGNLKSGKDPGKTNLPLLLIEKKSGKILKHS